METLARNETDRNVKHSTRSEKSSHIETTSLYLVSGSWDKKMKTTTAFMKKE